jgi:hypothetical protein
MRRKERALSLLLVATALGCADGGDISAGWTQADSGLLERGRCIRRGPDDELQWDAEVLLIREQPESGSVWLNRRHTGGDWVTIVFNDGSEEMVILSGDDSGLESRKELQGEEVRRAPELMWMDKWREVMRARCAS